LFPVFFQHFFVFLSPVQIFVHFSAFLKLFNYLMKKLFSPRTLRGTSPLPAGRAGDAQGAPRAVVLTERRSGRTTSSGAIRLTPRAGLPGAPVARGKRRGVGGKRDKPRSTGRRSRTRAPPGDDVALGGAAPGSGAVFCALPQLGRRHPCDGLGCAFSCEGAHHSRVAAQRLAHRSRAVHDEVKAQAVAAADARRRSRG
jgi:hypothetical protein